MSQEPLTRASIEQLPDEIIDRIFALVDDPDQISARRTLGPDGFPWNVASVSKAWRRIALSRPGFWSIIELDLIEYSVAHSRPIFQVEPITFETIGACQRVRQARPKTSWCFSFSTQNVRLDISFELFDVLDGVRNRLSILSKLALEPYGLRPFDEFTAFEIAPCLESVTFRDEDNIESYRFPTQQFKALKGSVWANSNFADFNLFEQYPSLEDCEIEYTSFNFPENVDDPNLSLERPNLRRLVTNAVFLTQQRFHFPGLKTLVSYFKDICQNIHDINQFIANNHCSLNRLLISGYFEWEWDLGDPEPVHRLFELVPQLTYLGITEEEDTRFTPWDTLARHLVCTVHDSTEPLVPHLNEIAFVTVTPSSGEVMEKLEEMIAFRTSYREGRFRAGLRGFSVARRS